MVTYFVIVGVLCLCAAAWLLARRMRVLLLGRVVQGLIAGHETRTHDGTTSFLPIVRFVDDQGREHCFTAVAGGTAPKPALGRPVRVRYLASDPRQAYVGGFLHMWAAPLALAGLLVAL